jgi:hypothetical protein
MSSSSVTEPNWNQIILDHQTSGLSIKEFCQIKGLRYHQFYHFKRKLSGKKSSVKSSFAKVKVVTSTTTKKEEPRVVIYYNDLSVALEGDQDLDLIVRICHKLGQA